MKKHVFFEKRPQSKNHLPWWSNILLNMALILFCLLIITPVILAGVISVSSEASYYYKGYSLHPTQFSDAAYRLILEDGGVQRLAASAWVSIKVMLIGTVLSVLLMTMYAYVLARKDFRYRRFFSFVAAFTLVFNGGLVPWYYTMTAILNLQNSILAFIFPQMVNVWFVFILRTNIQSSVPQEIIDSSRIDGAGDFRIFSGIVLPAIKPAVFLIAMLQAANYWTGDFSSGMLVDSHTMWDLNMYFYRLYNIISYRFDSPPTSMEFPDESLRFACLAIGIGMTIVILIPLNLLFQQAINKGTMQDGRFLPPQEGISGQ